MQETRIKIIPERCVGCGLCLKACPFNALSLHGGKAVVDDQRCTLCGACAPVCRKYRAIDFQRPEQTAAATGQGALWVFAESDPGGRLAPVIGELLGEARRLAQTFSVPVEAILLGHDLATATGQCFEFGVERVHRVDHPELADYADQPYAAILTRLISQYRPEIFLGGATAVGRALLPRVAVMVGTGLTADCTQLDIDPENGLLRQTRPAFGGNVLATISCARKRPQMATVRPGVLPAPTPGLNRGGQVVDHRPAFEELANSVRRLSFRPRREAHDLREAEIVVTAGYGVGGPDGVRAVAALAKALGGSLGATRSVVDAGWVEYAGQIGQTGTTVQPKLYIACGVSGAIQHIVGMQNSERIVAINKDPEAPIFNYADVAVVGEVNEIVGQFLQTRNLGLFL